jgi:beta-lysine N6-acetyltransferase
MDKPDKLITIGNSIIQYGSYNKRIYLMHVEKEDLTPVLEWVSFKVQKQILSKVIGKISADCTDIFIKKGYRVEAKIPCYFNDGSTAFFMAAYYHDTKRKKEPQQELLCNVLSIAKKKFNQNKTIAMDATWSFRIMQKEDVPRMSRLYRIVFPSYPFPIYDEGYLLQTMNEQVDYFGIFYKQDLIALSSIEKNTHAPNAEMTDFATLPVYQGKGLAAYLLYEMEKYSKDNYHFKTIYTIARAYSFGINTIFSKAGYTYGGTLTNNTNIHGQIESMNVWYKDFSK